MDETERPRHPFGVLSISFIRGAKQLTSGPIAIATKDYDSFKDIFDDIRGRAYGEPVYPAVDPKKTRTHCRVREVDRRCRLEFVFGEIYVWVGIPAYLSVANSLAHYEFLCREINSDQWRPMIAWAYEHELRGLTYDLSTDFWDIFH